MKAVENTGTTKSKKFIRREVLLFLPRFFISKKRELGSNMCKRAISQEYFSSFK